MKLTNSASFYHERAMKSYSAIVLFHFKHFVTDDSTSKLDEDIRKP